MSSRPRFLLTFLAWAGGLSGGDRHLLEVAARWRRDVDIGVLAPPQAFPTIRTLLGDVETHALGVAGGRQVALGPLLALEYARRTATAVIRRLPHADVALGASHFTPDAAAVSASSRRGALGVGYVYHLIARRRDLRPRTLWSKLDERVGLALLRRFAGVVFVSNEETEKALVRRGFDPTRTAVGIDVSSFRQSPLRDLPPRGVFVGRLTRTKGVEDAIRAWAHIRQAVPDARLVMVGAGPERARGDELARQLGIREAIEWRGFVPEAEKRSILSESRVLLAPSYEEGWGIAVAEALASGLPVVSYRLPTLDEIFGDNYRAVPMGDIRALADAVVRVLRDDRLAEQLSNAGREAVQRYDLDRIAQMELETIFRAQSSNTTRSS